MLPDVQGVVVRKFVGFSFRAFPHKNWFSPNTDGKRVSLRAHSKRDMRKTKGSYSGADTKVDYAGFRVGLG